MLVDTWGYDVAQLTPLLALLGKQYIPELAVQHENQHT